MQSVGVLARGAALLAVAAMVASGCAADDTAPPPAEPSPSWSVDRTYQSVEFTTRDGQRRAGRLFGRGGTAVVLSHMGNSRNSQDDWAAFAEELARQGVQALTYERRATLGEVWRDLLGAADYLRAGGARRVVAVGASIGAMASLYAASQPDNGLHGVVWLAGVISNRHHSFQPADVARIACPMMVISGDQDGYGAADDARTLHAWTPRSSELLILPSQHHGTEILTNDDPSAERLTKAMTDFITRVSTGSGATC